MACGNDSGCVLSADERFVACESCDEGAEAKKHCDECLRNLCDRCSRSHGKRAGEERHRVEPGVCCYNMEMELCPEDGQKMSFFCQLCLVRVCPECELRSKKHLFHTVVTLDQYLGCEKEKLLERLDDVTTKTETISYLPDDIKAMATQIELKWLERKELMRQEFASLLETITSQQQKIMADMEEEVRLALLNLEKLQEAHKTVISTTCQLSDDCISAVQNLPRDEFLKSYPQFLESAKSVVNEVEKMSSPEDCMPAFLQMPFSLHQEKVHLHSCLQISAFDCQHIKAIEYNRFIPHSRLQEEVTVNMLVECPHSDEIPPSCTILYRAEVYRGSKQSKQRPAWVNQEALRSTDTVLNGSHGFKLFPGILYLVKIHPIITITTHQGDKTFDGKVVSIVIVTESYADADAVRRSATMASGDGQTATNSARQLDPNFNGLFRGNSNTLALTNIAGAGNQNNINNNSNNDNNWRSTPQHNNVSNSIIVHLNHSTVGHLLRPVLEAVFVVPDVSGGLLGPSGGRWLRSFGGKKCIIEESMRDKDFPGPEAGGRMQCQKRYVSICSFEEARLLEDTHLKV